MNKSLFRPFSPSPPNKTTRPFGRLLWIQSSGSGLCAGAGKTEKSHLTVPPARQPGPARSASSTPPRGARLWALVSGPKSQVSPRTLPLSSIPPNNSTLPSGSMAIECSVRGTGEEAVSNVTQPIGRGVGVGEGAGVGVSVGTGEGKDVGEATVVGSTSCSVGIGDGGAGAPPPPVTSSKTIMNIVAL